MALAVKTPLFVLVLATAGAVLARDRAGAAAAGSPVALVAVTVGLAIPGRVPIGERHILVVYPFLAMLAGHAAVEICRRSAPRAGPGSG